MPIEATDINVKKSALNNDLDTNGGSLTSTIVFDGQTGGFFPKLTKQERTTGLTRYRKRFIHNTNQTLALESARAFLRSITPSLGTRVTFSIGSQTGDYQTDTPDLNRQYSAGTLSTEVFPTDTTLVVQCETGSAADLVFQIGDIVIISNGVEYEETAISNVVWATDEATLTVNAITGNWPAGSIVSSAYGLLSDLKSSYTNFVVTSTAGTYDDTTYPIVTNNLACIDATWTLEFTSATNFTATTNTGLSYTGNISTVFAPVNLDYGVSYLTLSDLGWAGTYVAGDTVVFDTQSSTVPVWLRLVVSPLSPAFNGDGIKLSLVGES